MKTCLCFNGFFRCAGVFMLFAVALFLTWNSHCADVNQASPFLQRTWQSDQGLPHDSVHAMIQTRDGYLWIGTRKGVVRFDGERFITLEPLGATKDSISSLCEDKDGSVWIGTARGIVRFKDGKVLRYGPTDGVPFDDIRTVYQSKDGTIWIGRAGGLTLFQNGNFRNYTRENGLPHNVVRAVCETDRGEILIGTDSGLCRFESGAFSVRDEDRVMSTGVRCFCWDAKRNLWVGTQSGLFRKAPDGWDHLDKARHGLSDDFISVIYCDRSGQMWFGTYGGLNRMVNGKLLTELTAEGAGYDLVNVVLEDHEGNYWVGSKEGLTRLRTRQFTVITKQQGLTHNNVMSVLEDGAGTIWCGTWGGGLLEIQGDRITAFTNSLGNGRVLSLCNARDGSLWIGTDYGDGLFHLRNGTLTHYGEQDGLERVAIRVVYEDGQGTLWVGSRVLYQFKDGRFIPYTPQDGLAGETVRAILEDSKGNLWVGSNRGLSCRMDGKLSRVFVKEGVADKPVLAFYEDKEDNLWIGTGGGGLLRLRNGQLRAYTMAEGLFNDQVLEILEDNYGYLWMTCLKGVFRVSKKALDQFDRKQIQEIPCTCYGKDDGMLSVICGNVSKPAACKASDGRLWFATTKGLAVADPANRPMDIPPAVMVEEVIADKRVVSGPFARRVPLGSPVEISPGRGALEIHYTALSFRAPEKNRFKYKLDGVDPDWVEAGTRRVAYYNNIAPGGYTFQVIGCNNDGLWNSTGASVKVSLQPHYWQTWWFRVFAAVGSLATAAAWARHITQKRMALKLERLEQQHAVAKERARIAQDMHDDLGARLTEIRVLSNLTAKNSSQPATVEAESQRISDATSELIDNLHSIVWAVNPANDSLEKLADYIRGFAQPFLQASSIRCRFDCPTHLPDWPLSSEVRHNIFLVVKEALNNIAKHAGASEVQISVALDGSTLAVCITDNGKGFQPENASLAGNGLQNMEKRMQAINGRYELLTKPGQGTTIRIEILIKHAHAD